MLGHAPGTDMLTSRSATSGLTLIELLITLLVTAVVLAAGAPAMGQWIRDIEVRSSAGALLAALQATRAEALSRNATVRLQLVDKQGRPGWAVGCVQASARCPAELRSLPVDGSTAVRWGGATLPSMPALASPLAAGSALPNGISFDALGGASGVAQGTDLARIDVTHARAAGGRRMVLTIAAHGMARLCDPAAATGHPERCP